MFPVVKLGCIPTAPYTLGYLLTISKTFIELSKLVPIVSRFSILFFLAFNKT